MKRIPFEITKIDEDPIVTSIAKRLGRNLGTVSRVVRDYHLGYNRAGASNSRFLSESDILFVVEYFTMKDRWKKELLSLIEKHGVSRNK